MAKVKPIKASLGFKKVSANDVAARGNAVLAGYTPIRTIIPIHRSTRPR